MKTTDREAEAICKTFDAITSGMWPMFKEALRKNRVDVKDLVNGLEKLADQAGFTMPFTEEDF